MNLFDALTFPIQNSDFSISILCKKRQKLLKRFLRSLSFVIIPYSVHVRFHSIFSHHVTINLGRSPQKVLLDRMAQKPIYGTFLNQLFLPCFTNIYTKIFHKMEMSWRIKEIQSCVFQGSIHSHIWKF